MECFRSTRSTSQQSPAVYAHCVMTGSLPPPFIGTFVRCPLFCYRPLCGFDYRALRWSANPIQLVTYLWLLSTLAMWSWLFTIFSCFVDVCCRAHACVCVPTRTPDLQADSLPFWSCCFLSVGTWSDRESLAEAALSTQCSPKASWKAFYPTLCCLFFFFLINIPHSPVS